MAFLFIISSIYLIRHAAYNPTWSASTYFLWKNVFSQPTDEEKKCICVCDFINDILNVCKNELLVAEYIDVIS